MHTLSIWRRLFAALSLPLVVATVCVLAAGPAFAQEDPPGRVGRIADLQGPVQWFDHEAGRWQEATRNLPVTTGDRIATGRLARADVRVGSTTLRLDARTELDVLRLDDERIVVQLHKGSLALRVRSRDIAEEIEMLTAEARLRPLRSGHFRIDRNDDTTQVGAWRGELRVDDVDGVTVSAGQRADLWRDGRGRALRVDWSSPVTDAFASRVLQDDERDDRVAASRWVSPEMTGAEELDLAGRWETHPDHGAVWFPHQVRPDWAPYRFGRWTWVRPWGWTWVDEAPWGFAPAHYGRWVQWRDRWAWAPGGYVARPVYAPALVTWAGGGNGWSATVRIGTAPPAWQPLAPRDVYVPWYRHTPAHRQRVNEPVWTKPWSSHAGQPYPQPSQPRLQPQPGQVRPWPHGPQPQPQPQAPLPSAAPVPTQPSPLPVQTSPYPGERPQPIDRPHRGWRTPDGGDEPQRRVRPVLPGQAPAMPAPAAPVAPVAVPTPAPVTLPMPAAPPPREFRPPAMGNPLPAGAPIQVRPPRDDERKRIPEGRSRNNEDAREHQR